MKAIAITYTPHLVRAMAALAAIIAVSVFLYGVFLLEAVGNTAKRASAERQIRSLQGVVSQLEGEYLSKTRSMTLEHAQSLGFVTPTEISTVFATDASRTLSRTR